MAFDIHQLDSLDFGEGEALFESYQETLIGLFLESPEGQSLREDDPDPGFWMAQLMYYGFAYEGVALPKMTPDDVSEIVTELFPRKVSIMSAEEAEGAVPELVAFWRFLKRQFNLRRADKIVAFLQDIEEDFPTMMMDTSRFGMAKSFVMGGERAGFDMTTQQGMNAFMQFHNAGLQAPPQPEIVELPAKRTKTQARADRKHKRQRVRAARRRNRAKR